MGAQMLDLADKGFKATIINMLKDLWIKYLTKVWHHDSPNTEYQ